MKTDGEERALLCMGAFSYALREYACRLCCTYEVAPGLLLSGCWTMHGGRFLCIERRWVCRCGGQFFQAGALTQATESCQTVYHQGFLLLNRKEDLRRYSQGLLCKHKEVKIFWFIEGVSWSPMWSLQLAMSFWASWLRSPETVKLNERKPAFISCL